MLNPQSSILNPSLRIKMCGMTRIEDALFAAQLGVDAIGLIFYKASPRYITIQQAKALVNALPPFITIVAVLVDAEKDFIETILQEVAIDVLQFHGNESAAECRRYHQPYIKAIAVNEETSWQKIVGEYADAKAFLLDKASVGQPGGTGETFAWNLIPKNLPKPFILAGGLTPQNVNAAINQVNPFAVDVTSGIEAAKGIKDFAKMHEFVMAIKRRNDL